MRARRSQRQTNGSVHLWGHRDDRLQLICQSLGTHTKFKREQPVPRARALWVGLTLGALAAIVAWLTAPLTPRRLENLIRRQVRSARRHSRSPGFWTRSTSSIRAIREPDRRLRLLPTGQAPPCCGSGRQARQPACGRRLSHLPLRRGRRPCRVRSEVCVLRPLKPPWPFGLQAKRILDGARALVESAQVQRAEVDVPFTGRSHE